MYEIALSKLNHTHRSPRVLAIPMQCTPCLKCSGIMMWWVPALHNSLYECCSLHTARALTSPPLPRVLQCNLTNSSHADTITITSHNNNKYSTASRVGAAETPIFSTFSCSDWNDNFKDKEAMISKCSEVQIYKETANRKQVVSIS